MYAHSCVVCEGGFFPKLQTAEPGQNLRRLGALGVVGMDGSVQNGSVMANDVGRRHW